jgi:hypothetical protein
MDGRLGSRPRGLSHTMPPMGVSHGCITPKCRWKLLRVLPCLASQRPPGTLRPWFTNTHDEPFYFVPGSKGIMVLGEQGTMFDLTVIFQRRIWTFDLMVILRGETFADLRQVVQTREGSLSS